MTDPHDIIKHVAGLYGVCADELTGTWRIRQLVGARRCAVAALEELTDLSQEQIGFEFEIAQSSVWHLLKKAHRLVHDPKHSKANAYGFDRKYGGLALRKNLKATLKHFSKETEDGIDK